MRALRALRPHLTQHRLRAVLGAAAVVAAVTPLVVVRPRRIVVEGLSMVPTLDPGDRLLVARLGRLRVGDVVVLRDPRRPHALVVKRLVAVDAHHVVVKGDNPDVSVDSRAFGPVAKSEVLGRVLRRYWPPEAAGPLR